MFNIVVGIFCLAVAGYLIAVATRPNDDVPFFLLVLLATLNVWLGVLNLVKGFGGGA